MKPFMKSAMFACLIAAGGCVFSPMSEAALNEAAAAGLARAFETLPVAQDQAVAGYVLQVLTATPLTDGEWLTFSRANIGAARFTLALAQFWDYAMRSAGASAARIAVYSALTAADSAGRALSPTGAVASPSVKDAGKANLDRAADGGAAALGWLQQIAAYVPTGERDAIVAAFRDSLGSRPPAIVPVIGMRQASLEPRTAWLGMQMCLSIAPYITNNPAARSGARFLNLPEDAQRFWETYGIFVFDNGNSFSPEQIGSLTSLLSALPSGLHNIAALVSTQTFGADVAALRLSTQGLLVPITPMPLAQTSQPGEFTPQVTQPVAPLFTLGAAQQIVRAIQTEQFRKRPELQTRRDVILRHAGDRKEQYLRQSVSPQTYLAQPDELLPSVAYMWFIDTRSTFQTALDLFSIEQTDAMDTFLLFADLMSGGGATAPFYATDLAGRVARFDVPLSRTRVTSIHMPQTLSSEITPVVPTNLLFANGLTVDGTSYFFDLSDMAGVIRMTKTERR